MIANMKRAVWQRAGLCKSPPHMVCLGLEVRSPVGYLVPAIGRVEWRGMERCIGTTGDTPPEVAGTAEHEGGNPT